MTSVLFQGKPFNITVIQDYASTTDGEEAEVDQFYVKLDDFLELKPKKKKMSYSSQGIGSRKSRDTWSNRQVWPWHTK